MQRAGCGQTPTWRIRFWCSGGGFPSSRDVLLEEAVFKSRLEPPPLEWLSSGLLDIPSRACCFCWRRHGGPLPDPLWISVHASASTAPDRARDHYASSEKVFDQARQKLIQRFFQTVNQNERSLLSGMLPVCCYGLRACLCVWKRERASDALPRTSAGPVLPSWTTGNLDSRPWQWWPPWMRPEVASEHLLKGRTVRRHFFNTSHHLKHTLSPYSALLHSKALIQNKTFTMRQFPVALEYTDALCSSLLQRSKFPVWSMLSHGWIKTVRLLTHSCEIRHFGLGLTNLISFFVFLRPRHGLAFFTRWQI